MNESLHSKDYYLIIHLQKMTMLMYCTQAVPNTKALKLPLIFHSVVQFESHGEFHVNMLIYSWRKKQGRCIKSCVFTMLVSA